MKIRSLLSFLTLAGLLLSGCGTLDIQLESSSTTPPSRLPTATGQPPTQTPAPTGLPDPATPKPTLPPLDSIAAINMIDPDQGWATGQPMGSVDMRILHTADGGTTWQDVTPPLDPPANGVGRRGSTYFHTSVEAWVTYEDQTAAGGSPVAYVWFTADGGQSWSKSQGLDFSSIQAVFYDPSDLGFVDEQFGWLLAHIQIDMQSEDVAVFTTTDGGMTWQRRLDPSNNPQIMACPKTGLTFANSTQGWLATGDCNGAAPGSFLYRTDDGGMTWNQVTLPTPAAYPDIFTQPDASCAADKLVIPSSPAAYLPVRCGVSATQQINRWIYTSGDTGATWVIHDTPEIYGSFDFLDPSTGWMLSTQPADGAHFNLYITTDGAQTWTSIAGLDWSGKIDFVDAQNGWALTSLANSFALMRTRDGGATWRRLAPKIIASPASSLAPSLNLSLQYGSSLASGVTLQRSPASSDAAGPYWQVLPPYTQVTLNGYPVTDHALKPQVFLYPVAEFQAINEGAGQVIAGLSSILQAGPDGQGLLALPAGQVAPFLPLGNDRQLIHARLKAIPFQNGQGIAYLTQASQGMTTINNHDLVYTYQGLTSDGKYYIAAVLPVMLASLSGQPTVSSGLDSAAYFAGMVQQLESASPSDFTPNLDELDTLFASFQVN